MVKKQAEQRENLGETLGKIIWLVFVEDIFLSLIDYLAVLRLLIRNSVIPRSITTTAVS